MKTTLRLSAAAARINVIAYGMLLVLGLTHSGVAQPVDAASALQAGKTYMCGDNAARVRMASDVEPLAVAAVETLMVSTQTCGYVVNLVPEGYVLMSADTRCPPVKLESTRGCFSNLPPAMIACLKWELAEENQHMGKPLGKRALLNTQTDYSAEWDALLSGKGGGKSAKVLAGPLIQTCWNQLEPYNKYAPIAPIGPDGRALVGCVAVAMAQVIRYNGSPSTILHDKKYKDKWGICTGTHYCSDAGLQSYKWSLMPNAIDRWSPLNCINEVARLLYHCGVIVKMDYEANGSGSFNKLIPAAFRRHFGYKKCQYKLRKRYADSAWHALLSAEISAGRPVIYGFYGPEGGHSLVCDGVADNLMIHLNFGWQDVANNTWYHLNDCNGFNANHSAVLLPEFRRYSINGRVNGATQSGVTINLGGQATATTTTDGSGNYSLSGVNGEYTITPSKSGHTFWPTMRVVIISGANQTGNDFTAGEDVDMSHIPAGAFTMGDAFSEGHSEERPTHGVNISAFYMDKYEISKQKWDEVYTWATANGYSFNNAGSAKASMHPVQTISWYDCVKWCNARSRKEGLTPCYYLNDAQTVIYMSGKSNIWNAAVKWNATGYRLPTEAEWEKAARGGLNGRRFPWNDLNITHTNANYYSDSNCSYDKSVTRGYHPNSGTTDPRTLPTGYFASNGYGLYDMAGNVLEWCWDWYDSTYYSISPANDPRGSSSSTFRVVRGGGWSGFTYYGAFMCRVADRIHIHTPDFTDADLGFRCVRGQ